LSELLSVEKCEQVVMVFMAATDVRKSPPKEAEVSGQEECRKD
jgi:hypothetical protein